MTLKAFLFLFVVTLVAVTASAFIAERMLGPGFERGILIAVLSGLVVFPAARWAEYRGWIKGTWSPGSDLRKKQEERQAAAEVKAAVEELTRTPESGKTPAPGPANPDGKIHSGDPR